MNLVSFTRRRPFAEPTFSAPVPNLSLAVDAYLGFLHTMLFRHVVTADAYNYAVRKHWNRVSFMTEVPRTIAALLSHPTQGEEAQEIGYDLMQITGFSLFRPQTLVATFGSPAPRPLRFAVIPTSYVH